MGPRLVGRGKSQSYILTFAWTSLQWGRVLWDAESQGVWTETIKNPDAFNGAASCGTRKDAVDAPVPPSAIALQWGRVLWDAESLGNFPGSITKISPSMGPRLVGRGK